jgi:hypothetical protein
MDCLFPHVRMRRIIMMSRRRNTVLTSRMLETKSEHLIGDRAYDGDGRMKA